MSKNIGYTAVTQLINKYGTGWVKKEIVHIYKFNNHNYVNDSDIQLIKEYSMTDKEYGKKYNCISRPELCKRFPKKMVFSAPVHWFKRKYRNTLFINNNEISIIKWWVNATHQEKTVFTRNKNIKSFMDENNLIKATDLFKVYGKQWLNIKDIEIITKYSCRFIKKDDIKKIKKWAKSGNKLFYTGTDLNRRTSEIQKYCKEHKCTPCVTLTNKFGTGWKKKKIVNIFFFGGVSFVYNKDIPKIQEYYGINQTEAERKATQYKKGVQTLKKQISQYCKNNNCLQVAELKRLYPGDWDKKGKINIWKHGRYRFVSKNDLEYIKDYSMPIEQYCKKYNYVLLSSLIKKYGQGWYKQNIITTKKWKQYKLINTSDISKIVKYMEEDKIQLISEREKALRKLIASLYNGKIITNDRTLIAPFEIDIYLPDINLAFEFNGAYWHSDLIKDKGYHREKVQKCAVKKVRLIHIYEWELNRDNYKKTQQFIKEVLQNSNKIKKEVFNNKIKYTLSNSSTEIIFQKISNKKYTIIESKPGAISRTNLKSIINDFIKNFSPNHILWTINADRQDYYLYNYLYNTKSSLQEYKSWLLLNNEGVILGTQNNINKYANNIHCKIYNAGIFEGIWNFDIKKEYDTQC